MFSKRERAQSGGVAKKSFSSSSVTDFVEKKKKIFLKRGREPPRAIIISISVAGRFQKGRLAIGSVLGLSLSLSLFVLCVLVSRFLSVSET